MAPAHAIQEASSSKKNEQTHIREYAHRKATIFLH